MNREQKLSLIIGFTLILLVGVLISDHLSGARTATVSGVEGEEAGVFEAQLASNHAGEVAPFEKPTPVEPTPLAAKLIEDVPPGPGVTEIDDAILASADTADGVTEPFTLIDQSISSTGDTNSDLFSEIARRGGKLLEQGGETLLQLQAAPLAKTDKAQSEPHVKPQPALWHTVAQGESLWSIAEAYYHDGKEWKRIARHNAPRIGSEGVIRAGIRLEIPPLPGDSHAALTAQTSTESAGKNDPPRTYTVRKNDTIGEIAQKLLGSSRRWTDIAALNELEDEDVVLEGQVLKIPVK